MKHIYMLIGLMAVGIFITWMMMPTPDTDDHIITDLPWIIETDDKGGSRVFGLALGQATITQAERKFGAQASIGIFQSPDKTLSLEAYIDPIRLHGLQASIVLEAAIPPKALEELARQAIDKKPMPGNHWKLTLTNEATQTVRDMPVKSISYIPKHNVQREMLVLRFGESQDRITVSEGIEQWLYAGKGLAIMVDDDGRELFQYVRPDEFERLRYIITRPASQGTL